jgi:hypothetical protein
MSLCSGDIIGTVGLTEDTTVYANRKLSDQASELIVYEIIFN